MPNTAKIVLGLGGICIGLLGYRYAYYLSRFGEELDAIGSTRPMGEVEPTNWKVILTQISFLFLAALGAFTALSGMFAP
ncbi:hypothetical protein [Haladaptatus halobius]|uniref:hypothetical protein n=1 Tax=Haladaptatus halobius TaxID=2884875 RepID=UPI001D0AABA5|nr:hypothetical protein [Haladaptatus halobius]